MEKTKKLRTICNIALLVVGVLAALACLIFAMGDKSNTGALSFSMTLLYILIGVAIALILLFLILQVIGDKKKLVRVGILLLIGIAVVLFAYLCASSQLTEKAQALEVSPTIFKWSGALINMTYILLCGVIAAFFGTIIYSKLKK
ncbi:MAG: hypothetical protein IKP89_06390 [Bacteroidales bacterium]|jgi:hypothetical protein|nr:hypothetical protein [Bacteroidales bacterium]MBR4340223.1 hypothetical protein [Bacteroidales bacterium]MBR4491945.1 hypothetical protein [Bacteroidales bacterium]MBR4512214.1 hypothetical protein [Bacteroidales bacterium]